MLCLALRHSAPRCRPSASILQPQAPRKGRVEPSPGCHAFPRAFRALENIAEKVILSADCLPHFCLRVRLQTDIDKSARCATMQSRLSGRRLGNSCCVIRQSPDISRFNKSAGSSSEAIERSDAAGRSMIGVVNPRTRARRECNRHDGRQATHDWISASAGAANDV
jgi:hypothetical protein